MDSNPEYKTGKHEPILIEKLFDKQMREDRQISYAKESQIRQSTLKEKHDPSFLKSLKIIWGDM